ncbi:2OG-Fe(II) oxygenase [bacterium]|nr:2OG-Fe(II) oxygenase [bacterium]NDC94376.1 2OG-Fe(II) oxygenase [bacterium]NDD83920.1 2OG-Fe(II) oxygenase [bacterium]NDG29698.1 2OG-Fe(II) oxygenase [bacterium]
MEVHVIVFITVVVGILLWLCVFNVRSHFSVNKSEEIVFEYPNFLTHNECDRIIQLSTEAGLHKSQVYTSEKDNQDDQHRVSEQCWLDNSVDHLILKISQKAAEISGKPISHQETLQVVKYPQGGFFNPHYDPCVGDIEFCKRMNEKGGPRYMTLLVYLNDDYEGGETAFPKLDKSVKPQKGKAVVFFNTDNEGKILENSMHGGNPVSNGNKWICNKWVRMESMY